MLNLISLLAPCFDCCVTLEGVHPTDTYDYKKRKVFGYSVIETTMHMPKCRTRESWLYVAVAASANLAELCPSDKLYVGSQIGDRMFRGDGMKGRNFHHGNMRSGNGQDNLVNFLRSGTKAHIYRTTAAAIAEILEKTPGLSRFKPLLHQPPQPRKHVGYYFEQLILYNEHREWRWNTAGARDAALLSTL